MHGFAVKLQKFYFIKIKHEKTKRNNYAACMNPAQESPKTYLNVKLRIAV